MPPIDASTRQQKYRRRRQQRRVLVSVEVGPVERQALRSLELLAEGEASKSELATAVQRFIACAPSIADIPKRLYP